MTFQVFGAVTVLWTLQFFRHQTLQTNGSIRLTASPETWSLYSKQSSTSQKSWEKKHQMLRVDVIIHPIDVIPKTLYTKSQEMSYVFFFPPKCDSHQRHSHSHKLPLDLGPRRACNSGWCASAAACANLHWSSELGTPGGNWRGKVPYCRISLGSISQYPMHI